MISNRASKFIKSLQLKKYRIQERQFVVDGAKNVLELLSSNHQINDLYVTESFLESHHQELSNIEYQQVTQKELEKVSHFKTNNAALAVANLPEWPALNMDDGFTIALDRINDPGNLGTIIRIADWYGVKQIVCSQESVDCYNPKVIASSMGSFTRVPVYYENLDAILDIAGHCYAADMKGDEIYKVDFEEPGLLLFGSESHGIDQELLQKVKKRVTIPGHGNAESLNVAVSAAIFCDNIRRPK